MSVQEMRAELKVLRSEHPDFMPVSKMKKADISSLLAKMKQHTETTPAIALTKNEPKMNKAEPKEKGEVMRKSDKSDYQPSVKVKAVKAVKPEVVAKPEPKKKVSMKAEPVKEEKAKETMKDRMARIRAMRKKE